VLLDPVDDPDVYPSLNLSISFIWCIALHPPAMQQRERYIPWIRITTWPNQLFQSDTMISTIEHAAFPLLENETTQPLREDCDIRGQS
jgi:hypothetical protein